MLNFSQYWMLCLILPFLWRKRTFHLKFSLVFQNLVLLSQHSLRLRFAYAFHFGFDTNYKLHFLNAFAEKKCFKQQYETCGSYNLLQCLERATLPIKLHLLSSKMSWWYWYGALFLFYSWLPRTEMTFPILFCPKKHFVLSYKIYQCGGGRSFVQCSIHDMFRCLDVSDGKTWHFYCIYIPSFLPRVVYMVPPSSVYSHKNLMRYSRLSWSWAPTNFMAEWEPGFPGS